MQSIESMHADPHVLDLTKYVASVGIAKIMFEQIQSPRTAWAAKAKHRRHAGRPLHLTMIISLTKRTFIPRLTLRQDYLSKHESYTQRPSDCAGNDRFLLQFCRTILWKMHQLREG